MDIIMILSALVCWLIIGYRTKRRWFGLFMGIIWMLLPYNFFNLVALDDINIMLCIAISPMLIYAGFDYINTKTKIMPVILFLGILLLRQADVYMAAVLSGVIIIMLLVWKLVNSEKHGISAPIIAAFIPNIITFIQALTIKGFYRENFNNVSKVLKHSVISALNPIYNFENEKIMYYIGISILMIAVFGFICSHRKTNIGFLYGLLIMMLTIEPFAGYFVKISGYRKDRLGVLLAVSYAVIFVSLIMWDTLKKKILIFICIFLCIDSVFSMANVFMKRESLETVQAEEISESIVKEAQRITRNKMAVAGENKGDEFSQKLAEAMDLGEYLYVFDRCLVSRYDTVVVQKTMLRNRDDDIDKVKEAAEKEGYKAVASDKKYILFHYVESEDKTFEVKKYYKAIGIGNRVHQLAMIYPNIEESAESNIESYSAFELSKYDTVYLSGFSYNDKKKAEKIIKDTAAKGTKIVIDADNMPYDNATQIREFLGVSCNDISFENGYPTFEIDGKSVDTELFSGEIRQWHGVYLNGLDKADGKFVDNGKKVNFIGSAANKNIKFVGVNLIGYYALTYDDNIKPYIDKMLGFKQEDASKHEIVIKD